MIEHRCCEAASTGSSPQRRYKRELLLKLRIGATSNRIRSLCVQLSRGCFFPANRSERQYQK